MSTLKRTMHDEYFHELLMNVLFNWGIPKDHVDEAANDIESILIQTGFVRPIDAE